MTDRSRRYFKGKVLRKLCFSVLPYIEAANDEIDFRAFVMRLGDRMAQMNMLAEMSKPNPVYPAGCKPNTSHDYFQ